MQEMPQERTFCCGAQVSANPRDRVSFSTFGNGGNAGTPKEPHMDRNSNYKQFEIDTGASVIALPETEYSKDIHGPTLTP